MTALYDLHHGDCLDVLRTMPDNSVDAIVTDPPYGLSDLAPQKVAEVMGRWGSGDREAMPTGTGFMSASWDVFVPPPAVWDECLRVLKPGGHMAVFVGSRTQDLMGLSIRMAGFRIKDSLAWITGSGMPKGLDVEKAIESTVRNGKSNSRSLRQTEQDCDGASYAMAGRNNGIMGEHRVYDRKEFAAASEQAQEWSGWKTQLKPAIEPIILAQKPLDGTVANNVLKYGTGALNIDACRVGMSEADRESINAKHAGMDTESYQRQPGSSLNLSVKPMGLIPARAHSSGRFPANVLLDEQAAAGIDEQSGLGRSRKGKPRRSATPGKGWGMTHTGAEYDDEGGASRFFPVFKYAAKASTSERPVITREDGTTVRHPTVKPLSVMEWIILLLCPPGGIVLDLFAGSGSTLQAAVQIGMYPIGIERELDFIDLIQHRMNSIPEPAATPIEEPTLF